MTENEIRVTRSSIPPLDEYIAEIAPLWESHVLTNMGEKHREFEQMLRVQLHTPNVALFVNGHAALECALKVSGLHGKVITTPFTFPSTVHAIVRQGLEPVFADIKSDNFTIDPKSIETLIDASTCAIVPVHVYGNLCDVDAIQTIAGKYDLKVIYDAAHAFGVERHNPKTDQWESAASFGDMSMLSFHATKPFNSVEGGALCFRNPTLAEELDQWKNFGITGPESVEMVGGNAKMNELCAAMGICNLRHLDTQIEKRHAVAKRYWERLEGIPGIMLHRPPEGVRHNFAYFPVVFDPTTFGVTRDDVFEALATHDIFTRKYFYPLASDYACYRGSFDSSETPVAREVASRVLTLPMYADLSLDDVDRVCKIVKECAR